jgi:hypothetical protein
VITTRAYIKIIYFTVVATPTLQTGITVLLNIPITQTAIAVCGDVPIVQASFTDIYRIPIAQACIAILSRIPVSNALTIMGYFITDFIFMVTLFIFHTARYAITSYNITVGKSCAGYDVAIRRLLATRANADLTFITRVGATTTIAWIVGGIDTLVVAH